MQYAVYYYNGVE